MLYRSTRPIPPGKLNTRQYDRLQELSKQYQERGLLGQFGDINELREMVNKDLSLLLSKEQSINNVVPASEVETAKRPDIRVKTRAMLTNMLDEVTSVFAITVENHSPRRFFLSSVSLKLADEHGLWFPQDSLFHTPNGPQIIESGDSYSFHVLPTAFANIDVQTVVCAVAIDKIGRAFNSDAEETKKSLEGMMEDGRHRQKRG